MLVNQCFPELFRAREGSSVYIENPPSDFTKKNKKLNG